MIKRVDHVGIAVKTLDEAQKVYEELLGMEFLPREEVPEQMVRVAKGVAGESHVELLEPLSEQSPVAGFLNNKGPGIHHLCLAVDDLAATLERLKARGLRLIDEKPRRGAGGKLIAFVHPAATGGGLLELTED